MTGPHWWEGATLLILAVRDQNQPLVEYLLKQPGISLENRLATGETALIESLMRYQLMNNEEIEITKALVEAGADVNQR